MKAQCMIEPCGVQFPYLHDAWLDRYCDLLTHLQVCKVPSALTISSLALRLSVSAWGSRREGQAHR